MIYTSAQSFFEYAENVKRLSREEELAYAIKMKAGDEEAKQAIVNGYLPILAAYLKRYTREASLEYIYRGIETLNEAVEKFDFQIENPTFTRFLQNEIRRMATRYIADSSAK